MCVGVMASDLTPLPSPQLTKQPSHHDLLYDLLSCRLCPTPSLRAFALRCFFCLPQVEPGLSLRTAQVSVQTSRQVSPTPAQQSLDPLHLSPLQIHVLKPCLNLKM